MGPEAQFFNIHGTHKCPSLSLEKSPPFVLSLLSPTPLYILLLITLSPSFHATPLRVQALEELLCIEFYLVVMKNRDIERLTS